MGRAPFLEIDGQALHRIAGRWRVPLLFYTVTGRSEQACSMPPRYAFCLEDLRVFHLVRELPCLRAQGRHSECGAAAGAAGLHAPDGAETASTLPQVRGEGRASLDVEFRPRD